MYDYGAMKTTIVLASDVAPREALNVVGHVSLAIGSRAGRAHLGRDVLVDASGTKHSGISRFPVIVLKTRQSKLRTALLAARASELLVVDFPSEMLDTGHDDELAESIANIQEADIKYLGFGMHGATESIQSIAGGFSLWRLD